MPPPYVTSAEIDGDNNIVLSLEVDGFTDGESVEISGHAIQDRAIQDNDGGFATFSEVQTININKATGEAELKVTAITADGKGFLKGQDVTVVLQVSKVWMTVLSENKAISSPYSSVSPEAAREGWKWGHVKGVGGPDKDSSDEKASGSLA